MSTARERESYNAALKPHRYEAQRLIEDGCAFCGKPESDSAHRHLFRELAEPEVQERKGIKT